MNHLRRISTRRLIALCALTLVVAIGGTAIAVATSGEGEKPKPQPLANAVHDAAIVKMRRKRSVHLVQNRCLSLTCLGSARALRNLGRNNRNRARIPAEQIGY